MSGPGEARQSFVEPPPPSLEAYPAAPPHDEVRRQRRRDLLFAAFWFRVVSALTLATFFQPDEYFQSLEPAWQLAFGPSSGAWITWEWTYQLRSALHPTIIAAIYKLVSVLGWSLAFPVSIRARLLVAAPRVFHASCTTLMDYATWHLACRIFGTESVEASAAYALSLVSPWQWFAGSRSLSNGLEACLTTLALAHWPWSWVTDPLPSKQRAMELESVGYAIVFAAFAAMLRPTNVLIWLFLSPTLLLSATTFEITSLFREAIIYGPIVLATSLGIDRLYYGEWTFPAARFLYFNLAQDLAVFYGSNRVDYYFTEGLPILLTCLLPFAVAGIAQALRHRPTIGPAKALRSLAVPAIGYPLVLSLVSHKEVRFLHPLLAPLVVLAAAPFAAFFAPLPSPARWSRYWLFILFCVTTSGFTLYISVFHQRGPPDVLAYLREQFLHHNADALVFDARMPASPLTTLLGAPSLFAALAPLFSSSTPDRPADSAAPLKPISAAFLMPCHSTPWRSHLFFPEIRAWALTCEPPVGLAPAQRASYVDEADVFYADPQAWLAAHMGPVPSPSAPWTDAGLDQSDLAARPGGARPWPRYLVFFAQLEPAVRAALGAQSRYEECWRGFNSHWHDDWRRQGDVVVWCVDGGLALEPLRAAYDEEQRRRAKEARGPDWAGGVMGVGRREL